MSDPVPFLFTAAVDPKLVRANVHSPATLKEQLDYGTVSVFHLAAVGAREV